MEDLFNALVHCLGQVNPLYAVLALGVWVVFGDRLKGLLARIPLPKLPSLPTKPDEPAAPLDDLEQWLEDHPLLDRLWIRLKDQFSAVVDGDADEDEVYLKLLKAIKEVDAK